MLKVIDSSYQFGLGTSLDLGPNLALPDWAKNAA